MVNDDQIEAFSLEVVRIPGKRTGFKGRPRYKPEPDRLKVLQDFQNLRSELRQYTAIKHCNDSNTRLTRDPII